MGDRSGEKPERSGGGLVLVKIILIIGLLSIFYQDMRYRAVYWITFPILLAGIGILSIQEKTFSEWMLSTGYNLGFLLTQFLLIFIYFSIKARSWVNISSGYLGWGDILFLVCIAFYLSPGNYLIFYCVSLVVVLLAAILKLSISNSKDIKIPLAGMQALLFALLLLIDWQVEMLNVTNDSWLLNYYYVN